MNYTFKMIRQVAGKNIKSLYLPIVLSCLDALLHMGMFSAMVLTIIELIGVIFTVQKLTLYSVILVLLFLVRAILFSVNYTQVQYRGADISAQQRLALGDHIRSLNLGYFNKNSIGRLMSTLTTDITDFEQVLTHSLASLIKVLFFSALALLFAFKGTFSMLKQIPNEEFLKVDIGNYGFTGICNDYNSIKPFCANMAVERSTVSEIMRAYLWRRANA